MSAPQKLTRDQVIADAARVLAEIRTDLASQPVRTAS